MNFQDNTLKYPLNSHAIQVFAHPFKAVMSYMRCTCIVPLNSLSKIHHTIDIIQIPPEGLNHYTAVYGINSAQLKDKVVGHQIA